MKNLIFIFIATTITAFSFFQAGIFKSSGTQPTKVDKLESQTLVANINSKNQVFTIDVRTMDRKMQISTCLPRHSVNYPFNREELSIVQKFKKNRLAPPIAIGLSEDRSENDCILIYTPQVSEAEIKQLFTEITDFSSSDFSINARK